MADFIPALNTVQVQFNQRLYGQEIQNSIHFQRESAWSAAEMDTLAIAMGAWWQANYAPNFCHTLSLANVRVIDLTTQNSAGVERQFLPIPTGGKLLEGVPNNVALCIKFTTGLRGRSFRGRWYCAGIGEADINGNTFENAFVQTLVEDFETLLAAGESLDAEAVVVSRYANKAPRAAAVITPIIAVSGDTFADSQRRRLPGRGR